MTRREFEDNVNSFEDLIDFSNEIGCGICDDIIHDDDRDEQIDGDISDAIRYDNWYDIRDLLNEIPTGFDWYFREGKFDYRGLDDDDFEYYKREVMEEADNSEAWDDEEDEGDEDDNTAETEEADHMVESDISITELFEMCVTA